MLRTEPSLSIYTRTEGAENGEIQQENLPTDEALERTITIGDSIAGGDSGGFSFGKMGMGLIEERGERDEEEALTDEIRDLGIGEEIERPASPPMYLAAGLGIDGNDGLGGVDFNFPEFDESDDIEENYKRLIDQYPCHPLILKNYAQLLQSKGEFHGAEKYYHRAILADPENGEILSMYAKLVWEVHHDQSKALCYFERAALAAPQDSNILAAYASFLWEVDEAREESYQQLDEVQTVDENLNEANNSVSKEGPQTARPLLHHVAGLGNDLSEVSAADENGANVEESYKRMLEADPDNPLILKNYAQFLCQLKGDSKGAEEYYWHAMTADPGDGETISQYAKLVWDVHNDHDKAMYYFEKAVEATPGDSHVVAAYARFLWETEGEESVSQDDNFEVHGGVVSIASA